MDRWQRTLRFGRRATSNPPEDKKSTVDCDLSGKRSSEKLERLREITELLKVTRTHTHSPDPSQSCCSQSEAFGSQIGTNNEIPPIPPPRKPRTSLSGRNSGSIEKFIDTSASESGSPAMSTKFDHSNFDRHENIAADQNVVLVPKPPPPPPPPPPPSHQIFHGTLRPNTSATNLEYFSKVRDKEKLMLKLPTECESTTKTIRSANANSHQKSVPFRSASFSQIDYSSGKYIRSALGALKASLSKAKSPPLSFACRRERGESSNQDETKFNECTDIWIPLKGPCDKRNDLNLDLINTSATILEEDSEHSPTSNNSDAAPAATDMNESMISLKTVNAAQTTTDSPYDESAGIQGVDNYFQSATACLIPVPVYECANPEDSVFNACKIDSETILSNVNNTNESSAGDTNTDQIPAFSEIQTNQSNRYGSCNALIDSDQLQEKNKNSLTTGENIYKKLRRKAKTPTLEIDSVPSIAVTPGSSVSGSSFEEMDGSTMQQPNQSEYGAEFGVEVRKRYSNEDKNSENRSDDSNQSTSTSGTNSPKSQHNEKRRIDKSKRRKGMYIQWATLDKHNKEFNAVSWTVGDGPSDEYASVMDKRSEQPIWPIESFDRANSLTETNENDQMVNLYSLSPVKTTDSEIIYTPSTLYDSTNSPGFDCDNVQPTSASCDTFTPDSTYSQRPFWPLNSVESRRQSLSLQSSEEKDDTSSPPTISKAHSKIFLLRSDSTSDNEMSDRTPPSRDRTSQSPAPDLKRYSKRPLRGPYGQMLEAEMKKPAKQNYDGLLEELNRSERSDSINRYVFFKYMINFHFYHHLISGKPPFFENSL